MRNGFSATRRAGPIVRIPLSDNVSAFLHFSQPAFQTTPAIKNLVTTTWLSFHLTDLFSMFSPY